MGICRGNAAVVSVPDQLSTFISRFLRENSCWFGGFMHLRAADSHPVCTEERNKLIPKRAQLMTTALRSFLRFAQYRGELKSNLARACLPLRIGPW